MKPKKLIRSLITEKLQEGEWEKITNQNELNALYELKIKEELQEINASGHKDILEFVDLIQVAISYAKENGFSLEEIKNAMNKKDAEKGNFGRLALNNLNPENPSNRIYFESTDLKKSVFQIFADMHAHDCEHKTDWVGVCNTLIGAYSVKQGAKIEMGAPFSAITDIMNDKVIPILLLVDKKEFDLRNPK